MLKIKKFQKKELGIFDETNKKFVPMTGKNLRQSYGHFNSDVREYFDSIGRHELYYAAQCVLKEEKKNG